MSPLVINEEVREAVGDDFMDDANEETAKTTQSEK